MNEGRDRRLLDPAPGFVWMAALLLQAMGSQVAWTPETLLGRKPTPPTIAE